MVPFQCLQMVGHEVCVASPGKKSGDTIITAVHERKMAEQTYSERRGHKFELNCDFDKVVESSFDALVLPGGRAPEHLRMDKRVLDIVTHFIEKEKPIAAICHGIQLLTATNRVRGRTFTCFPGISMELSSVGALYKEMKFDDTIVDRNIVTAPMWKAHPLWLNRFLTLLGTKFCSVKGEEVCK
jgi:protease I